MPAPQQQQEPGRRKGHTHILDLGALLVSVMALVLSGAGFFVAEEADDRAKLREEAEMAQRVVFWIKEGGPETTAPEQKPRPGVDTVIVTNYGSFPIQDVVLEQAAAPLLDSSAPGVNNEEQFVQAVRIGTLGPCQEAIYATGEAFERVVFSDANGVVWARREATPPDRTLPDAQVARLFPDIRSPQPFQIQAVEQCG